MVTHSSSRVRKTETKASTPPEPVSQVVQQEVKNVSPPAESQQHASLTTDVSDVTHVEPPNTRDWQTMHDTTHGEWFVYNIELGPLKPTVRKDEYVMHTIITRIGGTLLSVPGEVMGRGFAWTFIPADEASRMDAPSVYILSIALPIKRELALRSFMFGETMRDQTGWVIQKIARIGPFAVAPTTPLATSSSQASSTPIQRSLANDRDRSYCRYCVLLWCTVGFLVGVGTGMFVTLPQTLATQQLEAAYTELHDSVRQWIQASTEVRLQQMEYTRTELHQIVPQWIHASNAARFEVMRAELQRDLPEWLNASVSTVVNHHYQVWTQQIKQIIVIILVTGVFVLVCGRKLFAQHT